jgi:hypothetical protein
VQVPIETQTQVNTSLANHMHVQENNTISQGCCPVCQWR